MNKILLTAFAVFSMMGATSFMASGVVNAVETTAHQEITDAARDVVKDFVDKDVADLDAVEIAQAIDAKVANLVNALGLDKKAALSLRASYTSSIMVELGFDAKVAVDAAILALKTTVENLAVQATVQFLYPNGLEEFVALSKGAIVASTGAAGAIGGLYFGSYVYVVGGLIVLGVAEITGSSSSTDRAALKSRAG